MPSNNSKWIIGGTGFAVLLAVAVYFTNRGYGEVNRKTYDYAKALYSICNRRDTGGLDKIEGMISTSAEAGDLSEKEARWLNEIIEEARAGEWDSAARHSRRMLADQVR